MACSQAPQWFLHSLIMSQTKTGASRFQGRLFKSAATSALALSAATGSAFLFINEANASTTTCVPLSGVLPATCTTADPALGITYSNTASVISTSAGFPASTFINLEGTGLDYQLAQQQIDTDFNPPYTGGLISSVYTVKALTYQLDGIDLSASGIGDFTVKKEVFADAGLTTPVKDLLGNNVVLELTGAGFKPVVPFAPISQIWMRDTFNNPVAGQSSIDNAQNTLRNVPGPLPILGAGAAFGFSRKLRSRIKASRTA